MLILLQHGAGQAVGMARRARNTARAREMDADNQTGESDGRPPKVVSNNRAGTGTLNFQITNRTSAEFRTWFRGEHTNYNPDVARLLESESTRTYVLSGWMPDQPFIGTDTQITAFGSCFAANISNWLSRRRYRVLNTADTAGKAYVVACGEGMVNSFVIRQQFEWAWENKTFENELWHGYKAEAFGYDPQVQAETRRIFDNTDFFILTFGLSEVWYDEPTGNVFWRTIPKDVYDPARHKFRVSTVEENKENLRAIYQLIRKHRPQAKVLFTLSPIPLIATFRDVSCITANSVSKAVLRVAIDEVMREVRHEGALYYWPSYELVSDVFALPFKPDRRHPEGEVLDYIMTLFEHVWCQDGPIPKPSLVLAWAHALIAARQIPTDLAQAILARRPRRLRLLAARPDLHPVPEINKALRVLCDEIQQAWAQENAEAPTARP